MNSKIFLIALALFVFASPIFAQSHGATTRR